jgi:hypothetical protein
MTKITKRLVGDLMASNHPYHRHSCVIVHFTRGMKMPKIVATGENHFRDYFNRDGKKATGNRGMHAEEQAIINLMNHYPRLYKTMVKDCYMFVIRAKHFYIINDERCNVVTGLSAPCKGCTDCISRVGIPWKHVYWSTD